MKPLPEAVTQAILLKPGDSVSVPAVSVKTKDGWKYETQVPYLHFRKHPVEPGLYIVTDIWMHPNATNPADPSSYCYTLRRIRSKRRLTNLEPTWREKYKESGFQEKYFSSQKVNYNCLDWDQLIEEGKVKTDVYKPGERFNLDEFKKDLGQVLYKHKASLSICQEYDGPWDECGTTVLRVVVNGGHVVTDGGYPVTLATNYRDFPVRRSEPTWDGGKPNRGPSVSTLVSAEQN